MLGAEFLSGVHSVVVSGGPKLWHWCRLPIPGHDTLLSYCEVTNGKRLLFVIRSLWSAVLASLNPINLSVDSGSFAPRNEG